MATEIEKTLRRFERDFGLRRNTLTQNEAEELMEKITKAKGWETYQVRLINRQGFRYHKRAELDEYSLQYVYTSDDKIKIRISGECRPKEKLILLYSDGQNIATLLHEITHIAFPHHKEMFWQELICLVEDYCYGR